MSELIVPCGSIICDVHLQLDFIVDFSPLLFHDYLGVTLARRPILIIAQSTLFQLMLPLILPIMELLLIRGSSVITKRSLLSFLMLVPYAITQSISGFSFNASTVNSTTKSKCLLAHLCLWFQCSILTAILRPSVRGAGRVLSHRLWRIYPEE